MGHALRSGVLATLLAAAAAGRLRVRGGSDPPQQLHIAYWGSPGNLNVNDGMAVSWATNNATATSFVRYGFSPANLTSSVSGEQTTYIAPSYGGMWHHTAVITGLAPNTTYWYSAGDSAAGFSAPLSFTTAPAADASIFPLTITTYGDMGSDNVAPTMALLKGQLFKTAPFIWHLGDLAYGDDDFLTSPFTFEYENIYNTWVRNMSSIMSTTPYMTLPGNHEAEAHDLATFTNATLAAELGNFTAYNIRFRMPFEASAGTKNMWYSFRYGSVHLVNIDSETDFPGAPLDEYAARNGGFGDQLAWLEVDLAQAAADRAAGKVSWILMGGHRPIYSRAEATAAGIPTGAPLALQAAVEPLLLKYGVDAYLCGHVHAHEIIWPTYNSTNIVKNLDNPPYTTYILNGAAGNIEGHEGYFGTPPPWSRSSNDQDYGVSQLRLLDRSTLEYTFLRATDGTVLDSFTLTRQH